MKFGKGNRASAGRPQGSANKKTLLGKDVIENYFIQDGGLETLLKEIDSLANLNDKINAKIKLLPYLMPKQKEVEIIENSTVTSVLIQLPKPEPEALKRWQNSQIENIIDIN